MCLKYSQNSLSFFTAFSQPVSFFPWKASLERNLPSISIFLLLKLFKRKWSYSLLNIGPLKVFVQFQVTLLFTIMLGHNVSWNLWNLILNISKWIYLKSVTYKTNSSVIKESSIVQILKILVRLEVGLIFGIWSKCVCLD